MPERGIVYNCVRPKSEEYNEFFFLVIENPLVLQQIEQKIQDLFFPPSKEYRGDHGKVSGPKEWNYLLMHFDSDRKAEQWQIKGLHKSVLLDPRLYDRKRGSLISYISKYIDKA